MLLNYEVALDPGCELCAEVHPDTFRRGGVSWMNENLEDNGMRHKTVERHLRSIVDFCVSRRL